MLSTAGIGAGYGIGPGMRYIAGLWLGNNLVALLVISGFSALLLAEPAIRIGLLILSAGYLSYLALRIALANSKIAFIESKKAPGAIPGVLLQMINPKAYAVHTTLFFGFAFYPDNILAQNAYKMAIMNAIWIPIHVAWLYAGHFLQKLSLGARRQFQINIVMAAAMMAVTLLALLSSFSLAPGN